MKPILSFAAAILFPLAGPSLLGQEAGGDAAPDLTKVDAALETDLQAELEKLAEIRKKIAAEKPSLAKRMNETAAELREKQRSYDIARSSREAIDYEFEKAEKQLKTWRDERIYIDGLLMDFRRNLETQSSLARAESQSEILKSADQPGDEGNAAQLALLEAAIARIASSGKVEVLKGKALDPDGVLQAGTFVEAGPVSWFLPESGNGAGLVAAGPELVSEVIPGIAEASEIQKLIDGKAGAPSFDPTLGTAVALDVAEPTFLEHIRQGGIWIFPILLLALIALIAAVAKWIQLIRIRDLRAGFVQQLIEMVNAGEETEALNETSSVHHPAARILAKGIKSRNLPAEDLEEVLYETFLETQPPLQRGLPFIAIASATAPLLGLLGTVTGMIHTFQRITIFGTGDTRSLTSGISEALVTTEVGLIVAIPALIAHALLSRKIQGIRSTMEMTSLAFLNGVKGKSS